MPWWCPDDLLVARTPIVVSLEPWRGALMSPCSAFNHGFRNPFPTARSRVSCENSDMGWAGPWDERLPLPDSMTVPPRCAPVMSIPLRLNCSNIFAKHAFRRRKVRSCKPSVPCFATRAMVQFETSRATTLHLMRLCLSFPGGPLSVSGGG